MKICLALSFLFLNFFCAAEFPNYDLHLTCLPNTNSKVMIVAHGSGENYTFAEKLPLPRTLITFNFPDYDYEKRGIKAEETTYGTIQEILPFLYVIKKYVVEEGHGEIDLYGFSAGGGAIINALAALNSRQHDAELSAIGISSEDKEVILSALQRGTIVLDALSNLCKN